MGITKTYCPEISGINYIAPIYLYKVSQFRQARITVTPYKSEVRYKYENENWQVIDGDNYVIQEQEIINPDKYYHVFGKYLARNYSATGCNVPGYWRTVTPIKGEFLGSTDVFIGTRVVIRQNNGININIGGISETGYNLPDLGRRSPRANMRDNSGRPCDNTNQYNSGKNFQTTKIVPTDNQPTTNCTFIIFNCNNIIYQEKRKNCPQVEINNCILDYQKQEIIDINLAPFEFLYVASGVVNILDVFNIFNLIKSALDNLPFLQDDDILINYLQNLLGGNEEECTIIFTHFPGSPINIIKQICSSCNCPPPQYLVECDPQEQCPYNTECEIDCGDYICCYDENGINLKTIIK